MFLMSFVENFGKLLFSIDRLVYIGCRLVRRTKSRAILLGLWFPIWAEDDVKLGPCLDYGFPQGQRRSLSETLMVIPG